LRAERNIAIILATIALLVGGLPFLAMAAKSLIVDDHFSLSNYTNLFSSRNEFILLRNSLQLAVTVTIISGLLGIFLGVVLGKTRIPLRSLFSTSLILPMLVPPFFIA
jgi:iron(III) transport system permease protein